MPDKPMSDSELLAHVSQEIQHSLGSRGQATGGSILSAERAEAMDAYQGKAVRELKGQEIEGRSKVTSADVQEVVDDFLPDAMQVLFNPQQPPVPFMPSGPDDEDAAEQETDAVNYVVCSQNEGFEIFNQYVFDASLQKNGFIKCWWDDTPSGGVIEYDQLSEEEVQVITEQQPGWEPIEADEEQQMVPTPVGQNPQTGEMIIQPMPVTIYRNVKFRDMSRQGKVKIQNIAPENFGINNDHNSVDVDSARFCYHREEISRSDLKLMYPDAEDVIDSLPHIQGRKAVQRERLARSTKDEDQYTARTEHASQLVEVFECYYRVDSDGDGFTELRKIVKGGESGAQGMIENTEVDMNPFCSGTVFMRPHRFIGWSLADKAMPTYVQKSTVRRQMMDNAYLANNMRPVLRPEVNIEDYMTFKPAQPIRLDLDQIGATDMPAQSYISTMPHNPILSECLTLITALEQERAGRTGIGGDTAEATAAMLGSNIGDWSVERLMTQREKRKALMIRSLAETGMKPLFNKVRSLLAKHQTEPMAYKKENQWAQVNPTDWATHRQMETKVGLGTGEANRERVSLTEVMTTQDMLGQQGSLLVDDSKRHNALQDWQRRSGLRGKEYFVDPESEEYAMAQQQQAQAQQQQSAEMAQMQEQQQQTLLMMEEIKAEAKKQADMMQFVVDSYKASTERADVEMTHDEQVTEQGPAV